MSRFVRDAVRALIGAKGLSRDPRPYAGLFLATAAPSGPGHLGLVRTRPALRDLNAMLAPEAFLLDATHALGAVALRVRPFTGRAGRLARDVVCPEGIASAEAQGDAADAGITRISMALIDAKDGRLEEALGALARLPADCVSSRLVAAAVCDLLGRADECDQWLAGIPEDADLPSPRDDIWYQVGLVAATLGGAPSALAGSKDRVASAAYQIINRSAIHGGMPVSQVAATAFLKLAGEWTCTDPTFKSIFRPVADAFNAFFGRACTLVSGNDFLLLDASQALRSAAVLRAAPLSGERVRSAARVAEGDLARAMEEGDASAAASLRLLLAFLAARDGRFEEALERYVEVARENLSDPWPRYLAHVLCLFAGEPEESNKWKASYDSLDPGSFEEQVALSTLKDELVVALALGGSPMGFKEQFPFPASTSNIIDAAASRVDAALVSALRDKKMPVMDRLDLWAVRTFLHAWAWSRRKELESQER